MNGIFYKYEILARLRGELRPKVSQTEMAKRCGMSSRQHYSEIERGVRCTIENLYALSQVLGQPYKSLLRDDAEIAALGWLTADSSKPKQRKRRKK